ncbi:MAG: DNA-directed RNA polymerase subunit omega [Paludibacteraceae bacterium]|nr:DNA-directed RNA polymerase subunit omega [Paludibacteraceae bacterium]
MEKKNIVPTNTITRDMNQLCAEVGNRYEAVAIIAKRSNQIAADVKVELQKKLQEFATTSDTEEEGVGNQEQIEISKHYERLAKPTLKAIKELEDGKIHYHKNMPQ